MTTARQRAEENLDRTTMAMHHYVHDYEDRAAYVEATASVYEPLLREWLTINDTPCRHDHHGYCQAHFLEDGDDCIVKRTREALDG